MLCRFAFIFLLFIAAVHADYKSELIKGALVEGVTVDLRSPTFCEGVLSTEKGGVITGPGIRIQAMQMQYTRKMQEGTPICCIVAEGNVMLEFGMYVFVGEKLEYDFQTRTGAIYCGRTGVEPWFFGGEVIRLCADGRYMVEDGYITTSESDCVDWKLRVESAIMKEGCYFHAKRVSFNFFGRTLFWLPYYHMNLSSIYDDPINYTAGWGGRQGPRVGMIYELFAYERWKAFLRLDYRLKRGIGGGIESRYHSPNHKENFETLNYVARDSSIFIPSERIRYRFQGYYNNLLMDDKLSIDFMYDKLSDKDMATDYADQGLDLEVAGRTQLDVRREDERWIANLFSRVRVNYFETVKQELPTFQTNWKPFTLGSTGIISDNQFQASYLDFAYAHGLPNVHNYHSVRLAGFQQFYRPFDLGMIRATPYAGSTAIFYGNSRHGRDRGLMMGRFGFQVNSPFYRYFDCGKHVIMPYAQYDYFTFPTVSPNDHYIFDIYDGWYRLDMLRFGVSQSYYTKDPQGYIRRLLYCDLYANAFFDTRTMPSRVPKVYSRTIINSLPTLRHIIEASWDFWHQQLDHFNFRNEWTYSPDFAIATEFRHRSSFDWRKADRDNFILDSFRPVKELLHSELSDRRDTLLLNFFYRFHPNWALEYESRFGWDRRNHTRYAEFEFDLLANWSSAIQVRFMYQHTEGEDRVAVYFSVGVKTPDRIHTADFIPQLSF